MGTPQKVCPLQLHSRINFKYLYELYHSLAIFIRNLILIRQNTPNNNILLWNMKYRRRAARDCQCRI